MICVVPINASIAQEIETEKFSLVFVQARSDAQHVVQNVLGVLFGCEPQGIAYRS